MSSVLEHSVAESLDQIVIISLRVYFLKSDLTFVDSANVNIQSKENLTLIFLAQNMQSVDFATLCFKSILFSNMS